MSCQFFPYQNDVQKLCGSILVTNLHDIIYFYIRKYSSIQKTCCWSKSNPTRLSNTPKLVEIHNIRKMSEFCSFSAFLELWPYLIGLLRFCLLFNKDKKLPIPATENQTKKNYKKCICCWFWLFLRNIFLIYGYFWIFIKIPFLLI